MPVRGSELGVLELPWCIALACWSSTVSYKDGVMCPLLFEFGAV